MKSIRKVARRWATSAAHAELEGAPHKALLSNTIGYYLSAQARRLGHRTGFRVPHQGVNWTFIEMKKNSDAFATGLVELGLQPGDRILSLQTSTAENYMTVCAAAKMGAVVVNIDPYNQNVDSIAAAIDRFQPRAIVCREFIEVAGKKGEPKRKSVHELIYQSIPEMDQVVGDLHLTSTKFPSVRAVIVTDGNMNLPGTRTVRNTTTWGPFNYYESPLRRIASFMTPDTPCIILPGDKHDRDVVYTHRNVMTAAFHTAQLLGLRNDTRTMITPHSYHTPTGFIAHYACLAAGSSLSYGSEHLSAEQHVGGFLEKLEIEKTEGLFATVDQLDLLMPTVSGQGVGDHLQWICVSSTQPLTPEYIKSIHSAFNVKTVYSCSGPLESASALNLTKSTEGSPASQNLMPNTSLRVVGDDGGKQAKSLGRGHAGALRLKGPAVTRYYWHNGGMLELDNDALGFIDIGEDAIVTEEGLLRSA
eukprot:TRINITY_DN358_c12_g1_i1.p1 TRINITY_DN358_c12_g1~~TRINITY_DN358_c12_g1_i1.p1  ORF type:complete len:498 (+),score=95.80 TRINITY_DN358_c12_g1_i1:70-1494(+)